MANIIQEHNKDFFHILETDKEIKSIKLIKSGCAVCGTANYTPEEYQKLLDLGFKLTNLVISSITMERD